MSTGVTYIDVMKYPVGYITDYKPAMNLSMDGMYADIDITLEKIPAAATLTIHIEVLNLTASQNSKFTISTRTGREEYTSALLEKVTNRYYPRSGASVRLEYQQRNLLLIGEFLQITYKGLSSPLRFGSVAVIFNGILWLLHLIHCGQRMS